MRKQSVNARWFQDQLRLRGLTQRNLARVLGVDPSAVSNVLSGKREMKLEEATALAKLFALPLDEILINAGIKPPASSGPTAVKIVGWVDENLRVHLGEVRGAKTAPLPSFGGGGARGVQALRFQANGGQVSAFLDGTVVYFRDVKSVLPDILGKLCVVKVRGEEWLRVAVVKRAYSAGHWSLEGPSGTIVAQDVVFDAASPVLWMRM